MRKSFGLMAATALILGLGGCEVMRDAGVTTTPVIHRGLEAQIVDVKTVDSQDNVFTKRYAQYKGKRTSCGATSDCKRELDQLIALDLFEQDKAAAAAAKPAAPKLPASGGLPATGGAPGGGGC